MKTNDSTRVWVDKAYKKLKGSVYFDKTQLPLLHELVRFEEKGVSKALDRLTDLLEDGDAESWADYESDITDKIDALVYPQSSVPGMIIK